MKQAYHQFEVRKPDSMHLSVIICTRNRAGELPGSIREVARQSKTFTDVEVLVVDNGSTDNTREVVEASIQEFGTHVRYIYERIAGLCQARNRGRAEARGTVLAYIDDDVIVSDGWVARLRDDFSSDEVKCLGGKVSADLGGELPFPMDDSMLWFFQVTNFGEDRRALSYPEHPIGCNMAFRTEVFDKVGGFDTKLKLYGDETDFFRRVHESGLDVAYDPNIEVVQHIPPDRLTMAAIRDKSFKWGQGSGTIWAAEKIGIVERLIEVIKYAAASAYLRSKQYFRPTFGQYFTYWYNRGFISALVKARET